MFRRYKQPERKQDASLTLSLVARVEVSLKDDEVTDMVDICVLDVDNTETVVITDWENNSVKSLYVKNTSSGESSLKLKSTPWGVTRFTNEQVAVTVPNAKQIMLINVNPDLVKQATITTHKRYHGITSLDESTLIVGCHDPTSVDIIDTKGRVKRSIRPDGSLLKHPNYLSTTLEGNVLVSEDDHFSHSVMCLSTNGDVLFKCKKEGVLWWPRGITSTTTGSIIVADFGNDKITQLSSTGEYVKDLLTRKDGIRSPRSICFHKNKLYVAQFERSLRLYSVECIQTYIETFI